MDRAAGRPRASGRAGRLSRRALLRRGGLATAGLAVPALYAALVASGTEGRIPYRVSVAGVALGGASREEARRRLDDAVRAYLDRALEVRAMGGAGGSVSWALDPAEIGLAFDLDAAVKAALKGGGHTPLDRGAALVVGGSLALPVSLEAARLDARLRAWAADATHPPVDAAFAPGEGATLVIVPDRPGLGIDLEASRDAFLAHAGYLASGSVALVQVAVAADITAPMLAAVADEATAATVRPLALRLGERTWSVGGALLREALRARRRGDGLTLALDPAALRPFLDQVARDVGEPAEDARLARGADGRYAVMPGRPGVALDEGATLAALDAALAAGGGKAIAVLVPRAPAVTAADLAPAYDRLDAILNTPLLVAFADYARTFGRPDLAPLLAIAARPDLPGRVAFTLDRAGVLALARAIAADLDRPARDAAFRWVDGRVMDVVPSRGGRAVDVAATADSLGAAILGATGRATPVVAVVPPRVDSADKAAMGITDRLGDARSDYSFSIPSRRHNVELATGRLDGTLIPPGGLCSFNAAVGAQTLANGYLAAYGIALVGGGGAGNGQVATVSSVAGGICQVSTMLFQAAYRAGLPIEERNWHLYWIPAYGRPPSGLQGLDATVDDQSGLDFSFRNTTGDWLAIEAVAADGEVRLALYGRDPGWTVAVADPEIGNPRPADPTPVREETRDLPPGEELVVERAVDGFDAVNRVRVTDAAGRLVREASFLSVYHPSRNVTRVGAAAREASTRPPLPLPGSRRRAGPLTTP